MPPSARRWFWRPGLALAGSLAGAAAFLLFLGNALPPWQRGLLWRRVRARFPRVTGRMPGASAPGKPGG